MGRLRKFVLVLIGKVRGDVIAASHSRGPGLGRYALFGVVSHPAVEGFLSGLLVLNGVKIGGELVVPGYRDS